MARRRLERALLESRSREREEAAQGPAQLRIRYQVPLSSDPHGIYSLRFAPAGGCLAAGFGNGAVQIVNVATASLHSSLFRGHRTRHAITALAYHPGRPSLLLAVGADGIISLYSMDSETPLATVTEKENEINAMDFCMDGSTYATAGKDRHIRLYDSHTNQLSHILQAPDFMTGDVTPSSGHSRRIFALRFHPGERHMFLTAGWDDCVKIWDKRMAKEAQRVINGPHICGPGLDIQGNCVLTGSWVPHNALQLWDLRTSQLQKNLPFPGGPTQGQFLYAARFCDQDIVMAGGSGTSGASAIHTGTNQVLGEILLPNKPVQAVAVAPGGRVVAVAGVGGNLHIADLH
ncbi:polycomb group protein FIE2-like isoform X3 [Mauremys reevesii]|uniref:polycomb group protein FIE2-like isoform X3 n=1 Tax=Mauremys reevesii TaxID=260615 RepID=UPI00193F55F4|nr:polycomb group protein FIE2-like isoform X3 [Mauremys reevesii]